MTATLKEVSSSDCSTIRSVLGGRDQAALVPEDHGVVLVRGLLTIR
jgi:hypothetical protein